jgi:uncharacterized membrane protein HdeD (DUF308 family)
MNEGSDMQLGGKFWLVFVAGAIGCAIAGFLLFTFIAGAWYRWGFLGMFLFFSAILLFAGWIIDRKAKRDYDDLGDALE